MQSNNNASALLEPPYYDIIHTEIATNMQTSRTIDNNNRFI